MPTVNTLKIPTGLPGSAVDLLATTAEQPVPTGNGSGDFRTVCDFSHMSFDDPIVYPGQPGMSHLHAFFGNSGVNANSTASSIANTGNSTCRGGTINRTGYWVPAMIDTKDGTPLTPSTLIVYYKTAYLVPGPSVKALPQGLRMIAGDSKGSTPQLYPTAFKCISPVTGEGPAATPSIPNCPVGQTLWQVIIFPSCWDGVNLDSPDHKSHMAYANGGKCPTTHPVNVPEVTQSVLYPVTEANAPLRWRLSSDNYSSSLPAGYSSHADWFNGWKPDVMDVWIKNCEQAAADCHAHLLGDGRMMTGVGT
jgi:hypothetical protein